jgi:tol-pal system protein YbgF
MGYITKGALLVLMIMMSGCASKGDLGIVQRDMDELKSRTLKMDKDLAGMRSETKEGMEATIKDFQKSMDGLRKGAADFQATLDTARVDMQSLAGKIDDVRIMTQKPADDIALLKEDAGRRLAALEERMEKQEKSLAEIQSRLAEMKTTMLEKRPEDLYQKGVEVFKSSDLVKARELFARFIELYPKNPLAANARYWTGETYYSEKNFDQAILEFQEVIKNFPDGEKAPAAMLKQAMSFNELGDGKSARFVLKKLIENYPVSPEAKLAGDKIKELK